MSKNLKIIIPQYITITIHNHTNNTIIPTFISLTPLLPLSSKYKTLIMIPLLYLCLSIILLPRSQSFQPQYLSNKSILIPNRYKTPSIPPISLYSTPSKFSNEFLTFPSPLPTKLSNEQFVSQRVSEFRHARLSLLGLLVSSIVDRRGGAPGLLPTILTSIKQPGEAKRGAKDGRREGRLERSDDRILLQHNT